MSSILTEGSMHPLCVMSPLAGARFITLGRSFLPLCVMSPLAGARFITLGRLGPGPTSVLANAGSASEVVFPVCVEWPAVVA